MKKLLTFVIIFLTTFAFCQKNKSKKITIEDLKITHHHTDTSAVASILEKKSTVKFVYTKSNGFHILQDVEYIYKIFNKKGLKYANFEIPYYVGYKEIFQDRVNVLEAETYNLEDDKIIKSVVRKESIFKTKHNEFWEIIKIPFPNVREGSIFKIRYQLKTFDIGELPDFHFQYDIPVDYAELRTYIPEFYIYKSTQTGLNTINIDSKMSAGSQSFEDEYNRSSSFSFKQVDNIFHLEGIPALKSEPFVDHLENYRITLFHELEVIRMPEQEVKKVAMSWEDVGQSIKSDDVFKDIFSFNKSFDSHLSIILSNDLSKEEMMHKLFRNIQSLTQWNGKYGTYKSKKPENIFQSKTGNISEINGLLIKMLREKEINAYPLLISTIDNGVAVFPTKRKFNAFITAVELNGKTYLMDASDKNSSIDVLPTRNLNGFGQMVKIDHQVIKIDLISTTKSIKRLNMDYNLKNNMVIGKLRNIYTHHEAYDFLKNNNISNKDNNAEKIEDEYELFNITNLNQEKSETDNKYIITETFDFESSQMADVISNKLMINPFLDLANYLNPFTSDERKLPIYFGYPHQLRFQANINIDSTMSVEHLPESISIKVEGDLLNFTYRVHQSKDTITASVILNVNQSTYRSYNYEAVKEFFNKMNTKLQEKIIIIVKK